MPNPATYKSEPIPKRAKVYYVLIACLILAAVLAFLAYRAVVSTATDDTNATQQYNNSTNPGSTENTEAPAIETGTPEDRTNPDPSGGNANTLLNPENPDSTVQ